MTGSLVMEVPGNLFSTNLSRTSITAPCLLLLFRRPFVRPDTIKTMKRLGQRENVILLSMLVGLAQAMALVNLIWLRSQMFFERVQQKTST
jgi:hypothetical protein